jgi:hypothetical protein
MLAEVLARMIARKFRQELAEGKTDILKNYIEARLTECAQGWCVFMAGVHSGALSAGDARRLASRLVDASEMLAFASIPLYEYLEANREDQHDGN